MIKKRNLDPSLIQWVMSVTGLGPGIGKIFYVAPETSSTSQYRSWWQAQGVERDNVIYKLPSAAYADMVAGRNDVMLVAPGLYTETADITWSKAHTHMIGLGGPMTEGDSYVAGVVITSGLALVHSVATITISGAQCQFHNVLFEQGQAVNTALTACRVSGASVYMKNCGFLGLMVSQSATTLTTSSSLEIISGGQYGRYEDCTIGSPYWYDRTGVTGQILFSNAASVGVDPGDIVFKGCRILDHSETAAVPAILTKANYSVDRIIEFRDCTFYNYANDLSGILTSVIADNARNDHLFLLTGTTAQYGWATWSNYLPLCFSGVPVCSATGGTALVCT